MTQTFDTLGAARDLEAAGLKREVAEAVAGAIRTAHGDYATKADLIELETRLETRLEAMEARFQAMLWRALPLHAFAIVGTIITLEKLIP